MPICETIALQSIGDTTMLNIKDMPEAIKALPRAQKNFVIMLAQDGLLEDWNEGFDALNECMHQQPNIDPDSYDYY